MSTVHFVVPGGIDDPRRTSGGNVYDREICAELARFGWDVRLHEACGAWPWPDDTALAALQAAVGRIPAGATVLVDGLVASSAAELLASEAERLRLVVLVHMPLGAGPPGHVVPEAAHRERALLTAARSVVTTSEWARDQLLSLYGLPPDRVHVATPGVHATEASVPTPAGTRLLCVGAVAQHKGHDVLVAALSRLADLSWCCLCVGSVDRDAGFVTRLRADLEAAGLTNRVRFVGVRTGAALDGCYRSADVLVHPSRGESYGMVVAEALAHGLPVIGSDVGGVPEALGGTGDGRRPGLLAPPGDVDALAATVRRWLCEPSLRARLRAAAAERRSTMPSWSATAAVIATALAEATP
ncbi:MAG TPA: glycosyltransferase family 4 protein [Jatrophihabitans sp.]|nr:glycosyltransferase family 4 protein [Jatrophihabitans sp.]